MSESRALRALEKENDKLREQIKDLKRGGYIRHRPNCSMGEYNSLLTGQGCDCGLSQIMEVK